MKILLWNIAWAGGGWAGETEPPPAIWWECGAPVKPPPKHPELELDDGCILVLDGEPGPDEEWPVYAAN